MSNKVNRSERGFLFSVGATPIYPKLILVVGITAGIHHSVSITTPDGHSPYRETKTKSIGLSAECVSQHCLGACVLKPVPQDCTRQCKPRRQPPQWKSGIPNSSTGFEFRDPSNSNMRDKAGVSIRIWDTRRVDIFNMLCRVRKDLVVCQVA